MGLLTLRERMRDQAECTTPRDVSRLNAPFVWARADERAVNGLPLSQLVRPVVFSGEEGGGLGYQFDAIAHVLKCSVRWQAVCLSLTGSVTYFGCGYVPVVPHLGSELVLDRARYLRAPSQERPKFDWFGAC